MFQTASSTSHSSKSPWTFPRLSKTAVFDSIASGACRTARLPRGAAAAVEQEGEVQ